MDAESYENDATARIINERYVAIKVDRDQRPDVDIRYQAAVSAISGQGGWPLTAFLLPDSRVFYGGTYFPPEDRHGRMGFPKVLSLLADTFHNEHSKLLQNAQEIQQTLERRLAHSGTARQLSDSVLTEGLQSTLDNFDSTHGGFGDAPKFPQTSSIELLLRLYDRLKDQRLIDAVSTTLEHMARGGIYDQLGGGFHRYSTDERWIVPHFEKMTYDNAPLLTNIVHAFQVTRKSFFRDIAMHTINFVNEVLSDEQRGGFYASQDADVSPGDDGSYYTWSLEEARRILTTDELRVVQRRYHLHEIGEMHHDPKQNVLFIDEDSESIASQLHTTFNEVETIVAVAKKKLLQARRQRNSPFVDRTLYANLNGMMIGAYVEAFKAFGDEAVLGRAVRALERILSEHFRTDGLISHQAVSAGTDAFLDDQTETVYALLQVYEATADQRYLDRADSLMQRTMERFADREFGGFYDTPVSGETKGMLAIRSKPIQDSPTAAANSVSISLMNRLWTLTEKSEYREFAEKSLLCFFDTAASHGIFMSRYLMALDEFLHPPLHVVVVSDRDSSLGTKLFELALRTFRAGMIVSLYQPSDMQRMPATLRRSTDKYSRPVAYVCSGFRCAPPAYDADTLAARLDAFDSASA
jgi:uncharacterized protein YyaL (SSP411 family)